MDAIITKWGNSLALRIPNEFAKNLRVSNGSRVVLKLEDERLIIERPRYTIDELVSQITPENLHHETDTGDRVGGEEW